MFIDIQEEEVEIREVRGTPYIRKTRGRNSLRPLRSRVLPFSEKARRESSQGAKWAEEREREKKRERDKGNTGLASTQFPSLASNFRRIPPFILVRQTRSTSAPHYIRMFLSLSHRLWRASFVVPLSQSLSTSPAFPLDSLTATPASIPRHHLFLSPQRRVLPNLGMARLEYTVSALSPPTAIWLVNWSPLNIEGTREELQKTRGKERTDSMRTSRCRRRLSAIGTFGRRERTDHGKLTGSYERKVLTVYSLQLRLLQSYHRSHGNH